MGAAGIAALADALKGNENLRSLEVSYNPIEVEGGKALLNMLKFDLKVSSLPAICKPWLSWSERQSRLDSARCARWST